MSRSTTEALKLLTGVENVKDARSQSEVRIRAAELQSWAAGREI